MKGDALGMSAHGDMNDVIAYYDAHLRGKLEGFVEGNPRVERAWTRVEQNAPVSPRRILELGCGIGDICWRMARRWPETEVVGVDISPKSLEVARKLFQSSSVSFVEGPLVRGTVTGTFDLIVLMDVYEHIAPTERSSLHQTLVALQSEVCRIVLSFPTPRHLAWLRTHHPDQIQPVDEDVGLDTLSEFARDLSTAVLLYEEVDVWHEGDYVHAVLGKPGPWRPITEAAPKRPSVAKRVRERMLRSGLVPSRVERLALVEQRLGRPYSQS